MNKLLSSTMSAQITIRVNTRNLHRLLVGVAVANQVQRLVRFEVATATELHQYTIVAIRIEAHRHVRYTSRDNLRLVHYLMDCAICPLDSISYVLLK